MSIEYLKDGKGDTKEYCPHLVYGDGEISVFDIEGSSRTKDIEMYGCMLTNHLCVGASNNKNFIRAIGEPLRGRVNLQIVSRCPSNELGLIKKLDKED